MSDLGILGLSLIGAGLVCAIVALVNEVRGATREIVTALREVQREIARGGRA